MKQTYIVQHWYGAPTYIEAARLEINDGYNPERYGHDFNRVGCKSARTALSYLRSWREQAVARGMQSLYRTLTHPDARYEIISTPDGYNIDKVVASGMIKDL